MVTCSVLGCRNNPERKYDGISFHNFPKNQKMRSLWIAATGRINWNPSRYSKICSNHFDKEFLCKKGGKTYLKPDAVPISVTGSDNFTIDGPCCSSTVTSMEIDNSELMSQENVSTENLEVLKVSRSTESPPIKNIENVIETTSSPQYTPKTLKRKWKSEQILSEQRLKKLKALREKTRRLTKKMADLQDILSELRAKLKNNIYVLFHCNTRR